MIMDLTTVPADEQQISYVNAQTSTISRSPNVSQ